MKKISISLFMGLFFALPFVQAQEEGKERVEETFRTFWLINGQSVETLWDNNLMVTIGHRFTGTIDEGIEELFGFDDFADIRLGVAYGISNELTVGVGRNRVNKIYDGFIKYRILYQEEKGFPFSLTVFGSTAIRTKPWPEDQQEDLSFNHKMSYTAQILIASKLSDFFSMQLAPTLVHRNLAGESAEKNATVALGIGGRFKISESIALLAEWYPRFDQPELERFTYFNPIGFAIDFTSPRHSFQIQFTNATALISQSFLTSTTSDFFEKGIHIGFNITRKFGL